VIKVWKGALSSQTQLSPMTHFEKTLDQMKQCNAKIVIIRKKNKGFFLQPFKETMVPA
jgi:hypothetical protein